METINKNELIAWLEKRIATTTNERVNAKDLLLKVGKGAKLCVYKECLSYINSHSSEQSVTYKFGCFNISKETEALAKRIEEFLLNHARPNPNYEDEDEDDNKYTSPDADEFATIAKMLKTGQRPCKCTSSFLHGDYTPNTDGVRGIHDELKREINELREVQKKEINIAYGKSNEPK